MDKELYSAAEAGRLILTVNDRLSRYLLQAYDLEQQRQGSTAWIRPEILSVSAWLSRSQQRLPDSSNYLSKIQLLHVWETIIGADVIRNGVSLLNIQQTARRALQAHQMLISYAADFTADHAAEDHQAFLRWRKEWLTLAADKSWGDPTEIPWRLSEAVLAGTLAVPGRVVLAGFDEITPDLKYLCATLEKTGTQVEYWQQKPSALVRRLSLCAADPADEVSQCARWARKLLADDPSVRIAVVAPQLEAYQALIERIFTAELEPEALFSAEEAPGIFNLSLGNSLDREEVIFSALRLLRCGRNLEQHEVSWLLHTPYTGGAVNESADRARTDRELTRLRRFSWPLSRLPKTLSGLADKYSCHIPEVIKLIELISVDIRSSKKQLPGVWAEHFALFLDKIGWPGERGLSSREYQAVQRFKAVLGELASLDRVAGSIDRSEAVKLLVRLVNAAEFQAESGDAPVQVLGELESAGISFDHLWVLGLHDTALPKTPNPNPFIPLPVQHRHKMKRADAEREYHFAHRVTERLFSSAPDVVLSWPAQDNGAPQRPSPFVMEATEGAPLLGDSCSPEQILWQARPELEKIVDDRGPALSTRKPFSGGTGIIKDQALCPFRAYAHHRFRAEQVDPSDIGIDNMSRGTLAHTVLELFWETVGDQQTLLAFDDDALEMVLKDAVRGALDRLEREQRHDIPEKQRAIEHSRLLLLTKRWLDVERQRSDFKVLASEKGQKISIGNLSIRTRIDRIDELADGRYAIIDYKTGSPDPLQWLDERITEPQLPVYCLGMDNERIGAVMFGVVRGKKKERGFRGVARDIESWPGASSRKMPEAIEERGWSSFDDILSHWQKSLVELGDAFAAGHAEVDPVDTKKACRYCDLKSLCRITELLEGEGGHDDV